MPHDVLSSGEYDALRSVYRAKRHAVHYYLPYNFDRSYMLFSFYQVLCVPLLQGLGHIKNMSYALFPLMTIFLIAFLSLWICY